MWSYCLWSLELSHSFPCWLCFSSPDVFGVICSMHRSDALPLGSVHPFALIQTLLPRNYFSCPSWVRSGLESRDTQQAYYTQFPSLPGLPDEVNYLFGFFSPHGWIEKCVRVSRALCRTVSSEGWRHCCMSCLRPCTCWLLLYPEFGLSGAG